MLPPAPVGIPLVVVAVEAMTALELAWSGISGSIARLLEELVPDDPRATTAVVDGSGGATSTVDGGAVVDDAGVRGGDNCFPAALLDEVVASTGVVGGALPGSSEAGETTILLVPEELPLAGRLCCGCPLGARGGPKPTRNPAGSPMRPDGWSNCRLLTRWDDVGVCSPAAAAPCCEPPGRSRSEDEDGGRSEDMIKLGLFTVGVDNESPNEKKMGPTPQVRRRGEPPKKQS